MSRSPLNHTQAFIDLVDDFLRRADERAGGDGRTNFHSSTTAEFTETLSVSGAAVWRVDQHQAVCLALAGDVDLAGEATAHEFLQQLPLHEIRKQTTSPTRHTWFAREFLDEKSSVVLGVAIPEQLWFTEFEEILESLVRLHADVERRNRLSQLNRLVDRQNQLLNLIAQLHEVSRIDQACSILATDGAAVLDIDRIAVCSLDAGTASLVAATGIADPRDRANSSRALAGLAEHCAHNNADIVWSGVDAEGDTVVQRCLAESGSSLIRALQARTATGTRAVVVLEQFDSPEPANDNAPGVVHHFATAIQNLDERSGGLSVSRIRRSLRGKRGLIAATIALALLAMVLVPASFEVEAYGVIQPTQRRDVFAPESGLVESVNVTDSQAVASGSALLQLTNSDLALKHERLRGELETTKSQLAAVSASRTGVDPRTGLSTAAVGKELQQKIDSLENQIRLASAQVASLKVEAPFDGVVFFGDLSRSVERRTVQKGQFLLHFANPQGNWELLLKIPDTASRHVLQARDGNQQVTFLLRLAPGKTFTAKLDWVGLATELDETGRLSTPARVSLDETFFREIERSELRPGSGVIAHIDCGSKPIGYVWFHEAIDAVLRRLTL